VLVACMHLATAAFTTDVAEGGSVGVLLNSTSVDHMMVSLVPLVSYFLLNNQTFNLDIQEKTLLYKFKLN